MSRLKTSEGAWIQATGCHSAEKADTLVTGFVASTLPEIEMLVNVASDRRPFRDVLRGIPISESKLEALDLLRRILLADGQIHIIIDHPTQVAFVEEYKGETTCSRGNQSSVLGLSQTRYGLSPSRHYM